MTSVWWFVSCVCEGVQLKKLQTVVNKVHTLFLVFFKLRNTTQSTLKVFGFCNFFILRHDFEIFLKTSEDQVSKPSVAIRFDVVYSRVSPEDSEEQKCSFLFFLLTIILKYKKVFRVFIKSTIGTNSNQIAAEEQPYTIFRFSTQVFMVFRNGGVCSLFFQPLINTNFTKIFFSRPNLKK